MTKLCVLRIQGTMWKNKHLNPAEPFPKEIKMMICGKLCIFNCDKIQYKANMEEGTVAWYDLVDIK